MQLAFLTLPGKKGAKGAQTRLKCPEEFSNKLRDDEEKDLEALSKKALFGGNIV